MAHQVPHRASAANPDTSSEREPEQGVAHCRAIAALQQLAHLFFGDRRSVPLCIRQALLNRPGRLFPDQVVVLERSVRLNSRGHGVFSLPGFPAVSNPSVGAFFSLPCLSLRRSAAPCRLFPAPDRSLWGCAGAGAAPSRRARRSGRCVSGTRCRCPAGSRPRAGRSRACSGQRSRTTDRWRCGRPRRRPRRARTAAHRPARARQARTPRPSLRRPVWPGR